MEAGREGRSGVSVPSRLKVNIITSVGQVGGGWPGGRRENVKSVAAHS